jgi:hypothetical protein
MQNGRGTRPHVANPMQNGRWTCQNVAPYKCKVNTPTCRKSHAKWKVNAQMWQIPCKMTNSRSKPLQTLGKLYQPRNQKKNPKPPQKKS